MVSNILAAFSSLFIHMRGCNKTKCFVTSPFLASSLCHPKFFVKEFSHSVLDFRSLSLHLLYGSSGIWSDLIMNLRFKLPLGSEPVVTATLRITSKAHALSISLLTFSYCASIFGLPLLFRTVQWVACLDLEEM